MARANFRDSLELIEAALARLSQERTVAQARTTGRPRLPGTPPPMWFAPLRRGGERNKAYAAVG
jgi:hypothetical protein